LNGGVFMARIKKEYLQSAIFGLCDALVSTTGVIVGVITGTSSKPVVVLAGIVTILVEASSMGVGQYLSSKSAHQLGKKYNLRVPIISGVVMLVAYFLAGLVPLLPIFLLPIRYARTGAIVAALVGLFVVGYTKGKLVKVSPLKSAAEILILGGMVTAIGIIVGNIFKV
jgi:vacuolar iron transporter family protein